MQRLFAGAACALLLFLGFPLSARGQTITTAVLHGVVHRDSVDALGDVTVTLTSVEGGAVRSYTTTRDGQYRFALLQPGTYTVLVERLGFRPKRIDNVTIRAGSDVKLDVSIAAAPPPVGSLEVLRVNGDLGGSRAGVSQTLTAIPIADAPWRRRELYDLTTLATSVNADLEVEGLPSFLSTYMIDGVRYSPARHPNLARDAARPIGLPINSLLSAEIVTADADLEWSGFAGGALAAQTRRGSAKFEAHTFGTWSGGPLQSSKFFDVGDLGGNSLWGGLLLSGPVIKDTAHYVIGLEMRQVETVLPRPWELDDQTDAALVRIASDSFGVQLQDYTKPFAVKTSALSAFGRFDWQLGSDNTLSVRFQAGDVGKPTTETGVAASAVPSALMEGRDLLFSASLASRIHTTWEHEVRVGLGRSTRDFTVDALSADDADLPSTTIVASGNRFGVDPRIPAHFARTDFTHSQALVIPRSAHRLKLGLETIVTSHKDSYSYSSQGDFVFGGPNEFAGGRGAFLQTLGAGNSSFTGTRLGVFASDLWQAAPDLQVVAGLRFDIQKLPRDKIRTNAAWLNHTGIFNDSIPKFAGALNPRIGLTWNVGNQGIWIVRASAGAYTGELDDAALSEAISQDVGHAVRRTAGNLGKWPNIASPQSQFTSSTPLALLGSAYKAPLTSRASFGVSHRIGASTLHLSGSYRDTEYLTRRSNLNLLNVAGAQDQFGRSIFGTLTQSGQLIAGNFNRRFSDFDEVAALNPDGWSHYYGATAALEKNLTGRVGFFASYTYSHTTDNWVGAGAGITAAQLSPFPDQTSGNWTEGTSDFDLPHRASAGIDVRTGGSLQPHISALYRFRSGYAFTPGFRSGVDMNGDGSGENDPAFVDQSISGVSELANSWSCLQNQFGQFAERNSCRQPNVHALDVRAGVNVGRSGAFSAEVFAEGINLIESEEGIPDRALYLVNGTLTQNGTTINVPLVVNPHFGKPLTRLGAGRILRIGLQVNY